MSLNPGSFGPWPLFFAKDADQDLDFDDSIDDMMDPGALSFLTSMITAPGSKAPDSDAGSNIPGTDGTNTAVTSQPPVPSFQEGQLVMVMAKPSGPSSLKLTGDAQGKKPGPSVKAGELLTILDGALVNNAWIYLVHTKSGASGWIGQHQLKTQSRLKVEG